MYRHIPTKWGKHSPTPKHIHSYPSPKITIQTTADKDLEGKWTWPYVWNCLQTFQAKQLNVVTDHKKQRKQVVQSILFILTILIELTVLLPVVFTTIGYTDTMNIFALTCFIYLHAFRYLHTSQFVLVALALRSRFQAINEQLASLKSLKSWWLENHFISFAMWSKL